MSAPTVTFGALLQEGFSATVRDRKGLVLFALPAAAFLAIAWTFADRMEGQSTVMTILVELGLAYIAFFWQRRYLLGPEGARPQGPDKREAQREINRLAGRYVGRTAVYYLAIVVLALVISFPLFAPFIDDDPAEAVPVFLMIVFPVAGVLMVVSAPFLLAFPACASGTRMGWGEAWRLGRGHGLKLGVVVVLFGTPTLLFTAAYLFLAPITLQDSMAGLILFNVGIALLRIGGMCMALINTAYLYQCLTAQAATKAII